MTFFEVENRKNGAS